MNKKNLLIIPTSYPDVNNRHIGGIFIKEHLIYLKDYFKDVYVVVPTAFIPSFLIKYGFFKKYAYLAFSKDYTYDNIHVKYIRYPTLPFNFFRRYADKFAFPFVYLFLKINRIKYDTIFAHFTFPSGAIARMLSKISNIKYLLTVHEGSRLYDPEIDEKSNRFLKIWFDAAFVIRVSNNDIKKLIERGVPSDGVKYIPNGFNPKKFYPLNKNEARDKLHLPNKKIILNISRLYEVKGHKYLIDAIKMIIEKRKDVLCFIGSSGPLKSKLQKQINDLGIQDCVKLTGFVPDDKINLWMNACDVFILPSLSEGNPTIMFECLGCGKPFIGTKVGGESKIINSEDYGYLVEPANPKQLAEKILIALGKKWNKDKILNYAKQFTWKKIAEDTANLIYQI